MVLTTIECSLMTVFTIGIESRAWQNVMALWLRGRLRDGGETGVRGNGRKRVTLTEVPRLWTAVPLIWKSVVRFYCLSTEVF